MSISEVNELNPDFFHLREEDQDAGRLGFRSVVDRTGDSNSTIFSIQKIGAVISKTASYEATIGVDVNESGKPSVGVRFKATWGDSDSNRTSGRDRDSDKSDPPDYPAGEINSTDRD